MLLLFIILKYVLTKGYKLVHITFYIFNLLLQNKYYDLFKFIKYFKIMNKGPWGSLASFYLGVVVTRVQISAGPCSLIE